MRPIFEDAFVDALRLLQMFAPVGRDARVKNVMMAPLDHMDRVDLQITQMRDGCGRRLRARTERFARVQALGVQPDLARLRGRDLGGRVFQSELQQFNPEFRTE